MPLLAMANSESESTPSMANNRSSQRNSFPSSHEQNRFPRRQSLWQAITRNFHGRCLTLTVLICTCMLITFWCQVERINQLIIDLKILEYRLFAFGDENDDACDESLSMLPIICMVMLYIGYLVECWHCTTRLVLLYRTNHVNVYNLVEQMRQAQPIIWWKAACYHHIRHTRPIARYHRNDGTYTTTTASSLTTSANSQVIHERITTHVAGSYFSYSDCGMRDISKRLVDLERYPMTRIYFSKGFAFANERSAAEFDEQRSTFFRLNERYDHYLEIREGLDLVGVNFQEYMIAVGDRQYSPWYNNQTIFWLFSIAMLSWPIRILLEYNTANVNYQVVKLFGSNYQTMANGNEEELCPLSQTTTIDSLSNECLIAPSYSETMLAERIYCLRSCTEPIGDNEHFGNADDEDDEDEVDNLFIPIHNRQIKHKQSQTINGVHLPYLSRPVGKESDPPSYDEVIEDQRRTIHLNTNQRRTSFKTYWNQLISLVRNNLIMTQNTQMRRSITDKDFFQKYFYSNDRRKPWTSFGDISNNLITNV